MCYRFFEVLSISIRTFSQLSRWCLFSLSIKTSGLMTFLFEIDSIASCSLLHRRGRHRRRSSSNCLRLFPIERKLLIFSDWMTESIDYGFMLNMFFVCSWLFVVVTSCNALRECSWNFCGYAFLGGREKFLHVKKFINFLSTINFRLIKLGGGECAFWEMTKMKCIVKKNMKKMQS